MNTYACTLAGQSLLLIATDDSIVRRLQGGLDFEPRSLEKWSEICAAGGTVIDVGAYTGLFSIIAAKRGCRVIAFEPMRPHYERCLKNFDLNEVGVDLRYACASDAPGVVDLKYNPRVPFLTSGASLAWLNGAQQPSVHRVNAITIDSLDVEECCAIKIDVERAEPLVLAGARETIDRCQPALLVEVLGEQEAKAIDVPGYEVAAVLDQRNWLMLPA